MSSSTSVMLNILVLFGEINAISQGIWTVLRLLIHTAKMISKKWEKFWQDLWKPAPSQPHQHQGNSSFSKFEN